MVGETGSSLLRSYGEERDMGVVIRIKLLILAVRHL